MQQAQTVELLDETALLAAAAQFGSALAFPSVVYLSGELGAGKTTFARALIQSLGYVGNVKSPTYTLVETYETGGLRSGGLRSGGLHSGGLQIVHFDLYRLEDPEELHALGYRELTSQADLVLVEWPEKGGSLIPAADYVVDIEYATRGRKMRLSQPVNTG